jgi:trimethylamine--corrinoid protein Co-methyltransferase
MLKGFNRNFKPLEILTEGQIESIHQGTLNVLQEVGVQILHDRALELFRQNDCLVDLDEKRVRIPPSVVEECIQRSPSSFRVKAREPKNDLLVGGNRVYFRNFPGMDTVDLETWERRAPTRKEYYDLVTVLDALPNVHALSGYPYFGFEGLPEVMKMSEGEAAKARNSSKIQIVTHSQSSEIFSIRIIKATGGEAFGIAHPASPLSYYPEALEALFRFTEAGFPMHAGSGLIMGATGPATIAGSTVSNNAEVLALVVLIQLARPGTRLIANDFVHAQDMRSGAPAFGDIASSLHVAAFHQICRWYGIPSCTSLTGVSSSKRIDFQLAYEKTIPTLLAALAGSNIVDLHSAINAELTAHPVQAIMDDDIAGMIGRFLEGVEVNDETLALDLIEEVGPIPGQFLDKAHTRKWWRQEQYTPQTTDRLSYPEWLQNGKRSAIDYAKEKHEEILATHKPTPLTAEQEAEIEAILEEQEEYYSQHGLLA